MRAPSALSDKDNDVNENANTQDNIHAYISQCMRIL